MKILFLSDSTVSSVIRQELVAKEFHAKYGIKAHILVVRNGVRREQLEGYGVFFFIRPTKGVEEIIEGIRKFMPDSYIIVDQDDCFDLIPESHVAYKHLGVGNPQQRPATMKSMAMANKVVVSTSQLQDYYKDFNPVVISNGWSLQTKGWTYDILGDKDFYNIGWAGTITHREDFRLVQQGVMDFLNEHPFARIIIGADEVIYKRFEKIPKKQKIFVPMLPYEQYSYLVRSFDVLLAPLKNDKFNQFKSDIKLMEAGAAKVPWIASPIKNYAEWGVGGLLTNDYYQSLLWFLDETHRHMAGTIGHFKALHQREMNIHIDDWVKLLPVR